MAQLDKVTKNHWIVYLSESVECKLYLNKTVRQTIPKLMCVWEWSGLCINEPYGEHSTTG